MGANDDSDDGVPVVVPTIPPFTAASASAVQSAEAAADAADAHEEKEEQRIAQHMRRLMEVQNEQQQQQQQQLLTGKLRSPSPPLTILPLVVGSSINDDCMTSTSERGSGNRLIQQTVTPFNSEREEEREEDEGGSSNQHPHSGESGSGLWWTKAISRHHHTSAALSSNTPELSTTPTQPMPPQLQCPSLSKGLSLDIDPTVGQGTLLFNNKSFSSSSTSSSLLLTLPRNHLHHPNNQHHNYNEKEKDKEAITNSTTIQHQHHHHHHPVQKMIKQSYSTSPLIQRHGNSSRSRSRSSFTSSPRRHDYYSYGAVNATDNALFSPQLDQNQTSRDDMMMGNLDLDFDPTQYIVLRQQQHQQLKQWKQQQQLQQEIHKQGITAATSVTAPNKYVTTAPKRAHTSSSVSMGHSSSSSYCIYNCMTQIRASCCRWSSLLAQVLLCCCCCNTTHSSSSSSGSSSIIRIAETTHCMRTICYGAIDGFLTGSGLVSTFCGGLQLMDRHSAPLVQGLLILFCVCACLSDSVGMAVSHVWTSYLVTQIQARERRQARIHMQQQSMHTLKGQLVDALLSHHGLLTMDALSLADTLEGYPDLLVSILAGEPLIRMEEDTAMTSRTSSPMRASATASKGGITGCQRNGSASHSAACIISPSSNRHPESFSSSYCHSSPPLPLTASAPTNFLSNKIISGQGVIPNERIHGDEEDNDCFGNNTDYDHHLVYDRACDSDDLCNKATRESCLESLCLLISFTAFSVLPALIVNAAWSWCNCYESTLASATKSIASSASLFSGVAVNSSVSHEEIREENDAIPAHHSYSYHYDDRHPHSQPSPSLLMMHHPISVAMTAGACIMWCLGVWKSQFLDRSYWFWLGVETVLVFFMCVLTASTLGYVLRTIVLPSYDSENDDDDFASSSSSSSSLYRIIVFSASASSTSPSAAAANEDGIDGIVVTHITNDV